jgi:MFS family permease
MDGIASSKQLPYLFIYALCILFIGMGLMPVLPLYAFELGATARITGLYFSVVSLSFTAATMLTGFLATKFGPRRIFILAGVLGVPALILMGRVTGLYQLVIVTSVIWFLGGTGMALVNVFTGLYADRESRGRWFSLIALASPLGALTGGLVVGGLVDRQGYPFMFSILSLVWGIWPLLATTKMKDTSLRVEKQAQEGDGFRVRLRDKAPLALLMMAILFSMIAINVGRLGMPMVMDLLEFTPGEITSATAVAGLVTLPFSYFLGMLSDRLGRKSILILGYLMAAAAVLMLVLASQTWQFWTAASMLLIAMTVSGSVASAFATDLLSPGVLIKVLPWLTSAGAFAGILGFALTGILIETLGFSALFAGGAFVALVAAALVLPLRCERQIAAALEPGWSCDLSFRPVRPALALKEEK